MNNPNENDQKRILLPILLSCLFLVAVGGGLWYWLAVGSANAANEQDVYRRLADPIKLFGWTAHPAAWVVVAAVVLVLAIFYVVMMYIKDSRAVGAAWATMLGLLRVAVYVILAWVFLLPAKQKFDINTLHSKAVLLFDTSGSVIDTRDDLPAEGQDSLKLDSRQDRVLKMLRDEKVNFLKRLTDVNTITAYRFGSGLDEGYYQFADGRFFTRTEWEDISRHPENRKFLPPQGPMPNDFWTAWLKPTQPLPGRKLDEKVEHRKAVDGITNWDEQDRLTELLKYNAYIRKEKSLFDGTNIYQALLDTLTREQSNLTRGIVLISDGRSNLGNPELIDEIRRIAKEKKIPIFTIGVGAVRTRAQIQVVDVRLPRQIQPDDPWRVIGEVRGDGLPDEEFDIHLEITKVRIAPSKKDGSPEETAQEVYLVEQRAPKKRNPDEPPPKEEEPLETVSLGKKVTVTLPDKPKFDTSPRPRASVEFQIDPGILARQVVLATHPEAAAEAKDMPLHKMLALIAGRSDEERRKLESRYADIRKWGLGPTKSEGKMTEEYRCKVVVGKHPLVTAQLKEHLEKSGSMRVQKKPLNVLVFSSIPSNDYQFLRELLIRETQKDQARFTIVLQTADVGEGHKPGVVQGVPERRFLAEFPSAYRPDIKRDDSKSESADAINDLASYDVVVAFDPDWTRLKEAQGKNLAKWVENGGGLIVLGGPICTFRLAHPGPQYRKALQPIVDILPVVLMDTNLEAINNARNTDRPWRLQAGPGATPDLEFLKLQEDPEKGGSVPFLSDWDNFYGISDDPDEARQGIPRNGFFSFYPVTKAAPGSQVLFTFGDAKTSENEPMPYFVISDPRSQKRVVWIGSSETRRLRQVKEAYFERFWTKLLRFAGARTQGKEKRTLTMEMGGPYKTNQLIEVDARYIGPGGEPKKDGEMSLEIKPRVNLGGPLKLLHTLKPRGKEGMFAVKFTIPEAGIYDVELSVPGTDGVKETGTLEVQSSNPEKDDTSPDFETLYKLASEADEVKNRAPAEYEKLLSQLLSKPLTAGEDAAKTIEKSKPRLFFELKKGDLRNIEMIPTFIDKDETVQTIHKKPEDQWNTGFLYASDGQPILSYVLLLVVGLLSAEWLTRKLLRLA